MAHPLRRRNKKTMVDFTPQPMVLYMQTMKKVSAGNTNLQNILPLTADAVNDTMIPKIL